MCLASVGDTGCPRSRGLKDEQGLFVLRCSRAVTHKHQTADTGFLARRGFVVVLVMVFSGVGLGFEELGLAFA